MIYAIPSDCHSTAHTVADPAQESLRRVLRLKALGSPYSGLIAGPYAE